MPKDKRGSSYEQFPTTPNIHEKQSKRAFDGRVNKWRTCLHRWDSASKEKYVFFHLFLYGMLNAKHLSSSSYLTILIYTSILHMNAIISCSPCFKVMGIVHL